MTSEVEIVLPRTVAPQPSPAIVLGGDCGACCLASLTGQSVREAYGLVGAPEAWTWYDARAALAKGVELGLLADCVETVPVWLDGLHPAHLLWGITGTLQSEGWADYLRLAFGAGFYAIAPVDHAQRGPYEAGDHWVMLRGLRRRWVPVDNDYGRKIGARSLRVEVLVSSSAAGGSEEWVEVRDFLQRRGGFAVLLARPVD